MSFHVDGLVRSLAALTRDPRIDEQGTMIIEMVYDFLNHTINENANEESYIYWFTLAAGKINAVES